MKIRTILMSSCGLILSPNVWAQTPGQCAIAPTCGELGYEQQASDCTGLHMLKCPFDTSKVFCGGEACAADYALGSCDTSKGTCDECGGKYKYTACNSGWTLSGSDCAENDCSGYNSTSSNFSGCSTTASCQKGTSTLYKCTKCSGNFTLSSSGTCSCNQYCSGNYYLDSSSCSCKCSLSGSDCGSGYYFSDCRCQSCDDRYSDHIKGGITRAECQAKYGASCAWYSTTECGGILYSICENSCGGENPF